jgi:hypothetical protein
MEALLSQLKQLLLQRGEKRLDARYRPTIRRAHQSLHQLVEFALGANNAKHENKSADAVSRDGT